MLIPHELCSLFPAMSGKEFDALVSDIRENGLQHPIVIHEGKILDGINRYRACVAADIEPQTMKFGGGSIVDYVLSANLHRRHLTPGQQAAIVACVQDWEKAQTKGGDRKSDQSATLHFDSVEKRAAQSGASVRTQKTADKLAKAAPELAAAVGRGEISLPKAEKQAFPKPAYQHSPEECDDRDMLIDALKSTVDHLTEENERLKNALSAGLIPEEDRNELSARLETLTEENRKLGILNKGLIASRDSHMTENASLKKQCAAYQRKIKALEK